MTSAGSFGISWAGFADTGAAPNVRCFAGVFAAGSGALGVVEIGLLGVDDVPLLSDHRGDELLELDVAVAVTQFAQVRCLVSDRHVSERLNTPCPCHVSHFVQAAARWRMPESGACRMPTTSLPLTTRLPSP